MERPREPCQVRSMTHFRPLPRPNSRPPSSLSGIRQLVRRMAVMSPSWRRAWLVSLRGARILLVRWRTFWDVGDDVGVQMPPPHRAPFYKGKACVMLLVVSPLVLIVRTTMGDILQQQLRRRGILGLNRLEPVSNVWKSWSRWRPHGVVTVRREPRCATFLYGRFGLSNEDVQVAAQHVNHKQKFRRTRPGSATQLANPVSSTGSCQRAALSQVKTKHMTGRPGTPQPGGHGLWDIVVRGRTLKALSVTTGLLRFRAMEIKVHEGTMRTAAHPLSKRHDWRHGGAVAALWSHATRRGHLWRRPHDLAAGPSAGRGPCGCLACRPCICAWWA